MAVLKNHPGMFLNDASAASLERLEDDHGVQPITDAGRTPEKQQELINRWDRGGVYNRPPYLYEPARPKESSSHVKNGGEAVDVTNWRWWRENAAEYGWIVDFDWDVVHFRYDPSQDRHKDRQKYAPKKGLPKMFYAIVGTQQNNGWYLVTPVPSENRPMTGIILGAGATVAGDVPVIRFEWQDSINRLKAVCSGIYH